MNRFIEPTFKVNKKELEENLVEFELKPLVQGFGVTLGNSLRRVLLSSIPGAAVFAFKIKGVMQELETISGCLENVMQINLNIQKLLIKIEPNIYKSDEIIELKLVANKLGIITAKDIETQSGVSIVNEDLKLFEITDLKTEIEIDLKVRQGRGFSTFKETKFDFGEIGWIYLTSNFSPVENVNYSVEEIKVGEKSVSEKVVIQIKTNGTSSPIDVLVKATEILFKHFEFIKNIASLKFEEFSFFEKEEEKIVEEEIEISELDFSERIYNALRNEGITKLSELKEKSIFDLKQIKNIGDKSVTELVDKLKNDYKIILKK